MTWERRGPLAPLAPQEGGPGPRDNNRPAPEGLGERGESHRGSRQGSASWGEGRPEGARPPRREQQPERTPTAAEKDFQWRTSMRPDASKAQEETETPAPAAPAPVGRPRLNLQKRTVAEAADAVSSPSGSDSKASPFGAARPINTAAREQEIEEKRQVAVREKREADDKAKEDRRLAKQAAAEKEEAAAAAAEAEAAAAADSAAQAEEAKTEETKPVEGEGEGAGEAEAEEKQNGTTTEKKGAARGQESREPKSRATESGNWRSASNARGAAAGARGGRGGASRGPRGEGRGGSRANGAPSQQGTSQGASEGESVSVDEDGWTTVPNKKGRPGRPMA